MKHTNAIACAMSRATSRDPIRMSLHWPVDYINEHRNVKHNIRPLWDKATKDDLLEYKDNLDKQLELLIESLPHSDTGELLHNKPVPGWKEHVEEHGQRAIFWNSIWKQCGSPMQGTVADIKKSSRIKYHYAIRFARKQSETRHELWLFK